MQGKFANIKIVWAICVMILFLSFFFVSGNGSFDTCQQKIEVTTIGAVTSRSVVTTVSNHRFNIFAQFFHHLHNDGISSAKSRGTDQISTNLIKLLRRQTRESSRQVFNFVISLSEFIFCWMNSNLSFYSKVIDASFTIAGIN